MLYSPIAMTKKRGLVASEGERRASGHRTEPRMQLRALRIEALSQFSPLLAIASVLSCLVVAWTLAGSASAFDLVGWILLVVAGNWIAVRRLETNARLFVRREPPRRVLIEASLFVALVATLWVSLPAALYSRMADEIQTVLAGAVCAMMCGALVIATVPMAAIAWAVALGLGLMIGGHIGGSHLSLSLTSLVLCHLGFIVAVIRRIATLSVAQAERNARQYGEVEAAAHLMREYEESGSNCLWQTDANHVLSYATPSIAALINRPMSKFMGTSLPALVGGNGALGSAMLSHATFSGIEIEIGDGPERRAVALAGTPIVDSAGGFLGYRGSCTDITESRSSERRLRQLASHE